MDPKAALSSALSGDAEGKKNYNGWVRARGFKVWVDIDPGTDLWMAGVTAAQVTLVGRKWVHIERPGAGKWRILPNLVTVTEEDS